MLAPRYLIGFTGHRSGFDEDLVGSALETALEELRSRAAGVGGGVDLYASIAEGTDTRCVEAARKLGIAVHLLLPLPPEEFEKDFSSPQEWERSRRQIALARQEPGRGSVRVLPGELQRPGCYFDQGIQILEAADVLVAVWDGQPARGLGGTEQVVAHARRTGKPVVVIDPRTGQSRVEGDLEAAFAPDGIFDELAGIARETGADCASQPDTADEFQKCLDDIAIAEAGRFRPSIVRIILLHGAAALLAAIVTFQLAKGSAWEEWKWVLTATELLLVSYALWLGVHLHRRHTQSRWIRCRFACELVRGLRASVPLIDPLAPSVGVHDPRWRRFALSVGLLVNQQQVGLDPTALRDRYLATRLSETHPEGQIRHYLTKKPKALWWWKTTEQVSQWSALLAPAFVLASLANKTLHWGHQEHFAGWVVVSLMPIALPLLAGVANGIRQALDAGRRKERYPEMAERLIAIREHLGGLETRSSISRAVSQSEEILLDELREWQLTATTTGH